MPQLVLEILTVLLPHPSTSWQVFLKVVREPYSTGFSSKLHAPENIQSLENFSVTYFTDNFQFLEVQESSVTEG
jgi:hypothetical protein